MAGPTQGDVNIAISRDSMPLEASPGFLIYAFRDFHFCLLGTFIPIGQATRLVSVFIKQGKGQTANGDNETQMQRDTAFTETCQVLLL